VSTKEEEYAKVDAVVRDVVESAGAEIFDLKIIPFKAINLTLERAAGAMLMDEVARIHKRISRGIEAAGCNWEAYRVQLSTPGVHRPLRAPAEYPRFVGSRVRLHMKDADPHARIAVVGILEAADGQTARIALEGGGVRDVRFSEIADAHLAPKLPF
jgi:ribosome maturation factor RimP